jgi:hypothetical protein
MLQTPTWRTRAAGPESARIARNVSMSGTSSYSMRGAAAVGSKVHSGG